MALRDENGHRYRIDSYEIKVRPRLDLVEGLARHGVTNGKIAERLGVSDTSFSRWLDEYPELEAAILRGRDNVDLAVENSLLKRCLGYTFVEITKERKLVMVDGEEKYMLVPTKKVYKHVAPDVQACEYWLENRMGDRWAKHPGIPVNDEEVNVKIQSVAELMLHPVSVRTSVDEEELSEDFS